MKNWILIVVALLFFVTGCTTNSMTDIRLPVGYIPNVQFAPLYVAMEKGYFSAQGLNVQLDYSTEIDSMALVGANQIPFAIVSGEQVLLGRSQGLPVTYVLAWYQKYPVAIASLAESNILSPQDLKGKKVGIPILSGASFIGLEAILHAAGLVDDDVSLDTIGFTQVESLVTGLEDAVVVYAANEPIQMKERGYSVNILKVSDYLELVGNGLVTNEETLHSNPEMVRRMVAAMYQGIQYSLDHPEEAYQICLKFVENLKADDPIQMQILSMSMDLWKTNTLGYSNPQAWKNMQEILLQMGLLQTRMDLTDAYDNTFLPK
jgi:NitT/TauT family transport system substrate-binding protein